MLAFWIYACAAWVTMQDVAKTKVKKYGKTGAGKCGTDTTCDKAITNLADIKNAIAADDATGYNIPLTCHRFMATAAISDPHPGAGGVDVSKAYVEGEMVSDADAELLAQAEGATHTTTLTVFYTAEIEWESRIKTSGAGATETITGNKYDASTGETLQNIADTITKYLKETKYVAAAAYLGGTTAAAVECRWFDTSKKVGGANWSKANADHIKKSVAVADLTGNIQTNYVPKAAGGDFIEKTAAARYLILCMNKDVWVA